MKRRPGGEYHTAEEIAYPAYRWLGERREIRDVEGQSITGFAGGIGFAVSNYSYRKSLRVRLIVERQDGVSEKYLTDAYYCGPWDKNREKWQTHCLPLFPFDGCHGKSTKVSFSYSIGNDAWSLPSAHRYEFATLENFETGCLEEGGAPDKLSNNETGMEIIHGDGATVEDALSRINSENQLERVHPYFTRGNLDRGEHPIHEIHRCVDRVIERQRKLPHKPHYIHLAMFDFNNEHIAEHLVYARQKGVEVECIADWAQVSPVNSSACVAAIRRAGIPVYGLVRNTPFDASGGIASMHTKFIVFDGEIVHSSSYNLHFHLWGGNWENALFYYSEDFALIYEQIYSCIRNGYAPAVAVDPERRYNVYYSFGAYRANNRPFEPQDAILTEIEGARRTILICMFSLSYLRGKGFLSGTEMDVISALVEARNRGVRVRIILNGMNARVGPLSEPWDWEKELKRPLKRPIEQLREAWMEVICVYYPWSTYSPVHHKFAVFDDETVITESYNWYEASTQSDEVMSVLRDRRIANAYTEEAALILRTFRCVSG